MNNISMFANIVVCLFVFSSLIWVLKIIYSSIKISSDKHTKHNKADFSNSKLFVLLPVLHETSRLENTLRNFSDLAKNSRLSIEVVVITTEKEYLMTPTVTNSNELNTIQLVNKLKNDYPIRHLHYGNPSGNMSHQVNHAVRTITEETDSNVMFALYNADSIPQINSFDWITSHSKYYDELIIFQQYGLYDANIDKLKSSNTWFSICCLQAASLWQIRWAIGFEYFNASLQRALRYKRNISMNYCIGHGLFFNRNVFYKLGGFSETFPNEDAIFGLQASYFDIPIVPVPYFETCESPASVEALYIQKSTWHNGPRHAFRYYNQLKKHYSNKVKLFLFCTQLFEHATRWILFPALFTLL
ncbi:glycosyltransferase, partial [Vibrio mimicus]